MVIKQKIHMEMKFDDKNYNFSLEIKKNEKMMYLSFIT